MQQSTATLDNKASAIGETTIAKLFLQAGERWGYKRMVLRHKRYGIWNRYTWEQHYAKVKDFALGLMSMGIQRGDRIAIVGDAEPEGYWAIHGVWCACGTVIGMPVDALHHEVQYYVDFSDARIVIAKDQEQVDKLLRIKNELPKVERVIWWDSRGMHDYYDPWLTNFEDVSKLGRAYGQDHSKAFEERIAESQPDDICVMSYTSGTTGFPKGACHSHRSLLSHTDNVQDVFHLSVDDDSVMDRAMGTNGETPTGSVGMLIRGTRVNIPESPETYHADMREVAPHSLICVPLQWESIVSTIQVSVSEADFLKRFCYNQFLKVGYTYAECKYKGKTPGPLLSALHYLGDLLVFHPVRDRVGLSRLKVGVNSGYTLGEPTFRFLRALGIEVRQLYGSNEQGVMVAHLDGQIDPASVGVVLPHSKIKISEEGELLSQGPSLFSHYHKNPEATAKAKAGGWFHTGDSAYIDERGHVFVYGRMSEMGELSNGAKYSPQFIEAQLRFGAHIHEAVAIGNKQRDFVTAIITLDYQAATRWAEANHLDYTTLIDLSQADRMAALILKDIQRVNNTVPKESRIKGFVVLHKDFDADEGELTRTRKVKRNVVESRYAEMIEAMYSGLNEVQVNAQVTYQDGRTGTVTAAVKVRTVPEE